jgi:hypothetical protein
MFVPVQAVVFEKRFQPEDLVTIDRNGRCRIQVGIDLRLARHGGTQ